MTDLFRTYSAPLLGGAEKTPPHPDRQWMNALEMQFATLADAQRAAVWIVRHEGTPNDGHRLTRLQRAQTRRVVEGLKHAETYAWSGDTALAISHSACRPIPSTKSIANTARRSMMKRVRHA